MKTSTSRNDRLNYDVTNLTAGATILINIVVSAEHIMSQTWCLDNLTCALVILMVVPLRSVVSAS